MDSKKTKIFLNLCAVFYACLCIFSIVVGLAYAFGNMKLNTVELSASMMERLSEPGAVERFAVIMGWVTFAVGIIQGITSFAVFKRGRRSYYFIALGFTVFSLCSVGYKIIGKFSIFALSKTIAYILIIIILVLPGSRDQFFTDNVNRS